MATQVEVNLRRAVLNQAFYKSQTGILVDGLDKLESDVLSIIGSDSEVSTRAEINAIIAGISFEAARRLSRAHKPFLRNEEDFSFSEAKFSRDLIAAFHAEDMKRRRILKKSYISSRALAGPAVGIPSREILNQQVESVVNQLSSEIRRGRENKLTNAEIATTLRGTRRNNFRDGLMHKLKRDAQTLSLTISSSVSNEARFLEAQSVGATWGRVLATLDSRTSTICMGLDGKIYPIEDLILPPYHYRCRSEILYYFTRDEASRAGGERPAVGDSTTQVTATTTYNNFLKNQSVSFQNEALGVERAKLFRSGLSVDKFTDDALRPLTLQELDALYPQIFKDAGVTP